MYPPGAPDITSGFRYIVSIMEWCILFFFQPESTHQNN